MKEKQSVDKIIAENNRVNIILSVVCGFMSTCASVMVALYLMYVIDHGTALNGKEILIAAVIGVAIISFSYISNMLSVRIKSRYVYQGSVNIKKKLLSHVIRINYKVSNLRIPVVSSRCSQMILN